MILALRTDKPEAELYLVNGGKIVQELKWQAHRELASTILVKIKEILGSQKNDTKDIDGVIVYTGTGSFTGLRIGTSVANAFAYGLEVPVVTSSGENWIVNGIVKLKSAKSGNYALPKYDSEPNITKPKSKKA